MNQTVSTIIPCYNYGRFLGDCIESALGQTYQPIEIIVVNDGSTDETEEICLSYGGRIQYLRQSHQGIVQTINAGIERSHGAFFYFLSADDRLFPGTLEKQMSVMEKEEDCAVVCGNAKLINEQGEETGESILPLPEKDLLFRMLISPNLHDGSLLFRRSALEAIGELYFKPFENYHGYHHRCFQLARRYRLRHLNEYVVCQRVHHNNLSHPKNIEAMIEGYGILRKKMREIIDPCEILEGADPKHPKDRAHAHFLIASLFFHFGQYEIAYQDLKRAIELEPKIWERKEVLDDPRLNACLSPIMPVETICKDQGLTARIEVQKRTEVKEILSRIKEGEILKSFFLCRKGLEEAPEDPDCLLLLAVIYLSQRQWHDSLNRFHKVTKGLLEKIHLRHPFHSIDLYLCLALLKEEGPALAELHKKSSRLDWFDLNVCLWLIKVAIAQGRKELIKELQAVFRKKGVTLHYSSEPEKDSSKERKMKDPNKTCWDGSDGKQDSADIGFPISSPGKREEADSPLVSIIVPTYYRPDSLLEALNSILNQTYQNVEVIVVNDGGEDVEHRISPLNKKQNITYVKLASNRERSAARNVGIQIARGKYIAYLDDDDLFYPDHLETLVHFLEGSDYKVAYTDANRAHQKKENGRYVVVKRDVPYSFDFDYDRILVDNFVPVLCFMHERSCLDEAGCFDEDLTTLEDWDLWIRLSRKFKFAHIPRVTCEFSWREDGTTTTSGKKMDFLRDRKRIYEKYREYSKDKPNLHQVQETFLGNFDEGVRREYDRIQQLIQKNLIEEAISALEKLIVLSPAHSLAHDDLGALYFHRGDKRRALEHFIQSLKADPKNQNAMKNMADLRMGLGQMKEALQLYQMVLADRPMDVEALLGVGNYCLRAGRLGDASYFLKQVLEIEPENMAAKEYLDALANPEEEGVSPELRVNGESQPSTALPPKEEKEKIENPKVSIIIPVFNNLCLNRQCLKSIYQNTQDSNYEIIVVDNASTDGTTDFLRHEAAKGLLRVIRNDANLGFAKACNQGAEAAWSSYLMFLNNDTEPQKGWLEPLLEILENDPSVAAAGSKLLFPDGKIQHAGVVIIDDRKLPAPLVARHVYYEKPGDYNDANQRRTFQALTAACLLVRKSAFRQAGGFQEEFWNGYEDVDLCFKFQERSWKLVYQPESVVIHHESKSGPERHRRTDENTRLLHRRWLGKIDHDFIIEKDGSFTHSNFGFIRPYSLPSRGDEGVLQESESINIPLVSIVILVHNQLEYTKKCIESLFKYTCEPFELILVDNGSTDGTLQYLDGIRKGRDDIDGWRLKVDKDGKVEGWDGDLKGKGKIKKKKKKERKLEENKLFCKTIKVIPNERNLGFAAGNNQGMAEAKGDYILLMNNDVVVTPGWLERMIVVAEREPKIGIVGPMSNYVSGPQWVEKVSYDTATLAGLNSFAQSFTQRCAGQAKSFWRVVGFCMLIKRSVVEKIGGLDSRYGLGNFEDDDFSLRARLAGFQSWIAEDCFVHHFGSRTFAGSGIDYRESLNRNWEIFKKKWGIPAEVAYGADYDVSHLLEQNFIPVKHYCPLNPKEHNVSMGEELFAMGDLEGAKSIFEKILSENPNHKEALNNLGVIAFQQGEIDPAVSFFRKVLGIDPQCLEAIENMGNSMLVHHAYQEAILWFKKALEAEPNNVNLLNSLANCFIQIEEFEGAKEVYHRSYQLDCGQSHVEEILSGLEKLKTFEAQRSVTH